MKKNVNRTRTQEQNDCKPRKATYTMNEALSLCHIDQVGIFCNLFDLQCQSPVLWDTLYNSVALLDAEKTLLGRPYMKCLLLFDLRIVLLGILCNWPDRHCLGIDL